MSDIVPPIERVQASISHNPMEEPECGTDATITGKFPYLSP